MLELVNVEEYKDLLADNALLREANSRLLKEMRTFKHKWMQAENKRAVLKRKLGELDTGGE